MAECVSLTDDQKQLIYELKQKKTSQRDIARIVGTSLPTVNKHCQAFARKKREGRKNLVEIQSEIKKRNENYEALPAKIDITETMSEEKIKRDLLFALDVGLAELVKKLPEMSAEKTHDVVMDLFREMNKSANV